MVPAAYSSPVFWVPVSALLDFIIRLELVVSLLLLMLHNPQFDLIALPLTVWQTPSILDILREISVPLDGTWQMYVCSVVQSCPTFCDTLDYSPPGSSAHGIFQSRILEWVATSYSRGSSWSRDWVCLHSSSITSVTSFYSNILREVAVS